MKMKVCGEVKVMRLDLNEGVLKLQMQEKREGSLGCCVGNFPLLVTVFSIGTFGNQLQVNYNYNSVPQNLKARYRNYSKNKPTYIDSLLLFFLE
jgi:hypothetical protein